ncbi:MAG: phosphodiester glycosidase family protein [Candidatus Nanopelagicales bacterium]
MQTQHTTRARARMIVAGVLAAGVLAAVPTGWALDRYVIDHVVVADVSAAEQEAGTDADALATAVSATATDGQSWDGQSTDGQSTATDQAQVTDTSYTDEDTAITITEVTTGSGADTVTYYVADVVLDDARQLRSAFARDAFGANITEDTSDIAANNDAILAINGDYYGFRDAGIVIRNGVIYRDTGTRTGLALYSDGSMDVYDETQTTAHQLLADDVWNTLSFGPALLEDGQVVAGIDNVEIDTNFGNHSIQGEQPRTGIGIIDTNHYVFVVVDGRSPGYSRGVTMSQFAQIFADLGASAAYNLDGGGSATLYFDGEVVNDPLGEGDERATSDILYVG